jgi:aminodeoxyfutalosine deaminase
VHANFLASGDADVLGGAGASVVHCPRSHAFFGHQPFPLSKLTRAGVNVCLGTDSMASLSKSRREPVTLDMFSEMRLLAETFPTLKPESIIAMSTVNAAKAVGRPTELGRLAPGSCADLIVLPRGKTRDPYKAVLSHRGDVLGSMIRGAWAFRPA